MIRILAALVRLLERKPCRRCDDSGWVRHSTRLGEIWSTCPECTSWRVRARR